MKKWLYVFCLSASLMSLSSCQKNNDPAPVSPVVGRWELNRGLLSGFPASANLNGRSINLLYFESYNSTIDIFADNTFNSNDRLFAVTDSPGTWTFENNTLTLKYNDGTDSETYTYAKNKNIEELTSTAPVSYTLPVSSTATVAGQVALVYRK